MRNTMLAIVGGIVVLVIALYFVSDLTNDTSDASKKQNGDEYTEEELYDNQIEPDELEEKIDSGEATTVYFYSPDCEYCQRTTPVLVPLTDEMDIDMKKLDLSKYEAQGNEYKIEGTPTVVHYDDGEEVARITGEQSEEDFSVFFEEYVVDDT